MQEIHLHVHVHNKQDEELLHNVYTLTKLIQSQNQSIMLTQQELANQLTVVAGQVTKIKGETTATLQKVADLEAALQNQPNVTPEVEAAFNAVKEQVQLTDDLIADTPTDGEAGEGPGGTGTGPSL